MPPTETQTDVAEMIEAVLNDEVDRFEAAHPSDEPQNDCEFCGKQCEAGEKNEEGRCYGCAAPEEPADPTSDADAKLQTVIKRNRESISRWEDYAAVAKDAKDLKAEAEAYDRDTRKIISGFDEQLPLFDQKPAPTPAPPEPEPEAWRSTLILELAGCGLSAPIIGKLSEAGFATIGQLADHTAAGKALTGIYGIGPTKAEAIEQALAKFWEGQA